MKIAHLDTGREWRGGQNQVLLLMHGLRSRGHEVLLMAPQGALEVRARAEGLGVSRWTPRGEFDPTALLAAAGKLARYRPDIAHAHSARAHAVGVPAARLARVAGVVVSRRVQVAVAGNLFSRIKYGVGVDRYLCVSRGVAEAMKASGIPPERMALVPSGIDLVPVTRGTAAGGCTDLRALIGAPPGARIVGTVAALTPEKNHADLLRAAAQVSRMLADVRFVWLGEGECRGALERQRVALGLEERVFMPGFRSDALELMKQFTVFALASNLEGLCTSLLDAQSAGIPIVATAVGGVPEVIADGASGRLVPARDPSALASALIEALERAELAAQWVRVGLESVKRFSADRMVERTLEVYAEVLASRKRGS